MTMRDRVARLRSAILAAAASSGARDVRLFGSVARGEEGDESDVDVVVTLEPGRSLFDLVRLEAQLERLLGRRVDVVTEAGLREPVRSTVLREAVRV
jgi:predicted nucleotidyltransferase